MVKALSSDNMVAGQSMSISRRTLTYLLFLLSYMRMGFFQFLPIAFEITHYPMGTHRPITQQNNSGDQDVYKIDILLYNF